MEPITVDPEAILARLMERLPQYLNDPRTSQLLGEVAMRDAAIVQLQARIAELESQIANKNKEQSADNNGSAKNVDLAQTELKLN